MASKFQFDIKFKSSDMKKLQKFLSNETINVLKTEVSKAALKNALIFQAHIIQNIKSKKFKSNSNLTKILKGGDTPLIDTGDMISALEVELVDSFTSRVGFLSNSKTSHGGDLKRVVQLLHEGFQVKLTPAMKAHLAMKLKESGIASGVGLRAGSGGVIRVPPRPFLKHSFEDKLLRDTINQNWENAVKNTLKRMGAL